MYHGILRLNALSAHAPQQLLSSPPLKRINWPSYLQRTMASSSPAKVALKKRAVAGSFLFKIPHGDEKQAKVALFRRSGAVSTYQHKLAPVSGSIETTDATPMATALREIQEETTLTPSSLELLRVGKPYSFVDDSIGREWTINPFGFRLRDTTEGGKGEAGIKLDWEHEGIEWFDPLDVKESDEFGGVPKLVNSLRRVWPEYDLGPQAGKVLTDGLQHLRKDHESGARQLASMSLSILKGVIAELDDTSSLDESWWAIIRMAAWHLCKVRESMGAAITTAVVKALDQVEAIYLLPDMTPAEKVRQMVEGLDAQLEKRKHTADRISDALVSYLRQSVLNSTGSKKEVTVLTLSSSSTILHSLVQAVSSLEVTLYLHVLESRPLYEGVTLASEVLEGMGQGAKVKVTLYSDASAALAARDVDVLLLGADRVSSAGDVSNKIGSLPAVLSARHVSPRSKVIILSETEKIASPGSMDEHEAEENDPAELTRAWQGNVKGIGVIDNALRTAHSSPEPREVIVKNVYFEWVPSHLINAYATEEGIWTLDDIAKRSLWIGKEMERFFKDL
ncbi:translation initiation factor eIF-2B subunit family protein [Biscogniauxia sp. FL1348]|nr:translation initiation factor eIF-2B subunit family protein [Biscogniauxia sp. FL1348]